MKKLIFFNKKKEFKKKMIIKINNKLNKIKIKVKLI